ncbi:TlpA disulfide reductase family protein [Alkalicoccus urumqiensis]|uniref:TlpA disulfide reductase family protein n=1 Tax=Alkalicoccus urumqiensis TaxID=1548213 RepID=UPI0015E610EC|nr:TlpA disulfide reductase family protein [Alkalicoccus urumqiensis]
MNALQIPVTDMASQERKTLEDFKGEALIVTFWVSWCPDCRRDLEQKRMLHEAMTDKGLNMVMVHVPAREADPEAVHTFLHEHPLPFQLLEDNGRELFDAYECQTLPTTLVLNKRGETEAKFRDKASIQDMMPAVANAMM